MTTSRVVGLMLLLNGMHHTSAFTSASFKGRVISRVPVSAAPQRRRLPPASPLVVVAATATDTAPANTQSAVTRVRSFASKNFFILGTVATIAVAAACPSLGVRGGPIKPEVTIDAFAVSLIFLLNGLSLPSSELAARHAPRRPRESAMLGLHMIQQVYRYCIDTVSGHRAHSHARPNTDRPRAHTRRGAAAAQTAATPLMRLGCDVIDQRQETAVGIARLLGAGAERRGWCPRAPRGPARAQQWAQLWSPNWAWPCNSVAWPCHGVAWPCYGVAWPCYSVAWSCHSVAWPDPIWAQGPAQGRPCLPTVH